MSTNTLWNGPEIMAKAETEVRDAGATYRLLNEFYHLICTMSTSQNVLHKQQQKTQLPLRCLWAFRYLWVAFRYLCVLIMLETWLGLHSSMQGTLQLLSSWRKAICTCSEVNIGQPPTLFSLWLGFRFGFGVYLEVLARHGFFFLVWIYKCLHYIGVKWQKLRRSRAEWVWLKDLMDLSWSWKLKDQQDHIVLSPLISMELGSFRRR